MGGYYPVINPPPNFGETLGRAIQLRTLAGQQQLQQMQIQQAQLEMKSQEAFRNAYIQHQGNISEIIANPPPDMLPKDLMAAQQHDMALKIQLQNYNKDQLDNTIKKHTLQSEAASSLLSIDDPKQRRAEFPNTLSKLVEEGAINPQEAQQQLAAAGNMDDDHFEKMLQVHQYFGMTAKDAAQTRKDDMQAKEAQVRADIARQKAPYELKKLQQETGGFDVNQLNQALQSRWQVMHRGQALPSQFTLQPGASPKDFDRIDKMLEATEKATQSSAQFAESQAIREQTQEMARQRLSETEEKQGLKWVSYTDPKSGKEVAAPLSQAKAAGATDMAELGQKDVNELREARNVHQLISKQGDPTKAENMGVMQLIDSLDKDKKLGILSSRLNGFLAGKVGTLPGDDPRIAALLNKSDLAMTASMKAHFGASGGRSPQMLEHFLAMANAKKMDAPALRAGFAAIDDYMQDRGKIVPSADAPSTTPPTIKATHRYNPNTGKIEALP